MNIVLQNKELTATINTKGAELISLKKLPESIFGKETLNFGTSTLLFCFLLWER